MKKLVIIPGGFHPFHAGHRALVDAAHAAFPSADVYVAATADTSSRPFPFKLKQKLAQAAGVEPHRFIQVKSPFQAREITQHYDPNNTVLIFARSEKDQHSQPLAGGTKRDGAPSYLQPYKRTGLVPMSQHGYMIYLPTVQFGPGMTSATEIRAKWPELDLTQKARLVRQLYPAAETNHRLAEVIRKIFDQVMDPEPELSEDSVEEATLINDPQGLLIQPQGGMGTWDETSMVSNLAGKMASLVAKLKARDYQFVYGALYQDQWIQNMTQALAELQGFQKAQGARPIARGRTIDIGDYLDEAPPLV